MQSLPTQNSTPVGPTVDASPAARPQRIPLLGSFVSLVPLDPEAHAKTLYEGSHGPGTDPLWAYLFDGPYSDLAAFKENLVQKALTDDPLCFAIVDNPSVHAVGLASYMAIHPLNRTIEVGSILYTPSLQRTPGATEAMYLMARYAFEQLGYRRYEWKCNALNAPSRKAALRYGFTFEGIFRQHMIIKGRNRDTAWFSMLDSEWPLRRAAFERWLHPSNFDSSGRQIQALSALNSSA
jgi:RimJ/RimL family protein N-acetyltransferase